MRNCAIAAVVVVLGALAAPAAADAPALPTAYIGHNGTERAMQFISGCAATATRTVCADGADQGGPHVVAPTPGVLTLHFTLPATEVDVETETEADAGATAVDPTHWTVVISAPALPNGTRVHVTARGTGWQAVWVATIDQVAQPVVLSAPVARVQFFHDRVWVFLGNDAGPYRATFTAYVALHGDRVSTIARGPLVPNGEIRLTLARRTAAAARRDGRLVLTIFAGARRKTERIALRG